MAEILTVKGNTVCSLNFEEKIIYFTYFLGLTKWETIVDI